MNSRSRSTDVYRLYRCMCFLLMMVAPVNYIIARLRGVHSLDMGPVVTMILFGIPTNLAAVATKAGYLSSRWEILIGEVGHTLVFMIGVPMYIIYNSSPGLVNVLTVMLVGVPWSTTTRGLLSDLRANAGLPSRPLSLQLFIAVVPTTTAVLSQCITSEVIEEQLRHALVRSVVVHMFVAAVFLLKSKYLEELIADLQTSIDDRGLLLRSSFDATCYLRAEKIQPMDGVPEGFELQQAPLREQLEKHGLDVAGRLRVIASSPEMDQLFAQAMMGKALEKSRVLTGLQELTEVVMQAGQTVGEVVMGNRVLVSCVDQNRQEFDLEVRVVARENREGVAAVCGLRCVGEKRETYDELPIMSQDQATPIKGSQAPEVSVKSPLWEWLFADPKPEPSRQRKELLRQQPPVAQAIWRSLGCVPRLNAIRCTCPGLEIVQASDSAIRFLPSPLLGALAPTLVQRTVGQTFRRAAAALIHMNRERIEAEGCHVHSFGVVRVQTSSGLGDEVEAVFIALPASESQQPSLVVLFLPTQTSSWSDCGELTPRDPSAAYLRARDHRRQPALSLR